MADRLRRWSIPEGEVLIAASGSSRHSGLAAEILLEDLCGLAVDVEYASEYSMRGGPRTSPPELPGHFAVRAKPPTRWRPCAPQRPAARRPSPSPTILTPPWRAKPMFPCRWLRARELAIPATMSFTCQLAVLYVLALYEGERLGRIARRGTRQLISPGCGPNVTRLKRSSRTGATIRGAGAKSTAPPRPSSFSAAESITPLRARARSS